MFSESNGWPVSGGALIGALIYGGAALFITGPIIGARTIEKFGWQDRCARAVRQVAAARAPAAKVIPKTNCRSTVGLLFGSNGDAWCRMYGGRFKGIGDQIEGLRRQAEAQRQKQIAVAGSRAGSRCACAVSTTLEKRRVALAIYAGTLRIVTPPAVANLDAELMSALGSPTCSMKG